jgi:hypothetical protein
MLLDDLTMAALSGGSAHHAGAHGHDCAVGIELVAQLALQLRGQPSFYNGRG